MTEIRKTSDMMYPLEAPNGWFLDSARHEHTKITFKGDVHTPLQHPQGAWRVDFQKYPNGGQLTGARGHSLEEAWKNASEACVQRDLGNGEHG